MIKIEDVELRILSGEKIEEIVEEFDWKEFEELVSEILKKNEFETVKNFRFKTIKKFEVDIIAYKSDFVLFIDCKHWDMGRYKSSQIKKSIKKQIERVQEFKKVTNLKPLMLELKSKNMMPILVTWFQEELMIYESVLVVPIWKLNEFLNNIEIYYSQSVNDVSNTN